MKSQHMFVYLVCLSFLLQMFSCATTKPWARQVSMEPGKGGVIALGPQDDPEAREKAFTFMRQNCSSKPYAIVSEGEATVGSKTVSDGDGGGGVPASGVSIGHGIGSSTSDTTSSGTGGHKKSHTDQTSSRTGMGVSLGSALGGSSGGNSSTTREMSEWRISYTCGAAN